VGEHLADPLMIPLALAGSTFATATLSRHAETNLEVIRRFLGPESLHTRRTGSSPATAARLTQAFQFWNKPSHPLDMEPCSFRAPW
jgi:hypothetical protein